MEEKPKCGEPIGVGIAKALGNTLIGIKKRYGEERAEECKREVEAALKGEWTPPERVLKEREQYKAKYGLDLIDSQDIRQLKLEERHNEECAVCRGKCTHANGYEGYVMKHRVTENEDGLKEASFFVERCKAARRRVEQERIDLVMKSSGMPRIYAGLKWSDYRRTEVNAQAIEYGRALRSMWLSGESGHGKTMLCALIGKEAAARGQTVIYTTARELMSTLKPSAEGYSERAEEIKRVEALIIEDLGTERATEWAGEQLSTILDYRYREGLLTILTSRLRPKEALKRYREGEEMLRRGREWLVHAIV